MGHPEDCSNRQRLQRGRRLWLHDRVEIGHVARNMDRGDLPKTVAVLVEAADEPVDDEARMLDIIAKANEIAVRFHLSKLTRKVEDRLLLVAGQDRAT